MDRQSEQLTMLQDSITKLITVVKYFSEKTLSELSNNRDAIIILDEKVNRLISLHSSEEIYFDIIKCQSDLDQFENDLKDNSASYLNFFAKTGHQLSKFLSPEFLATLTLDTIKKTLFFNKIFAPLCCKRYLNPDVEITTLTRRAKNLISKRKSLVKDKLEGGSKKKK